MAKKSSSQKTVLNCPKALKCLLKALELIGKPFQKLSYLFLRFLILVGEITATSILLPLKLISFMLKYLKSFKIPNLNLSPISASLSSNIKRLISFRATLPKVPSIKVELRLSKILFKAVFWPCYYTGKITYVLLTFPLVLAKQTLSNIKYIYHKLTNNLKKKKRKAIDLKPLFNIPANAINSIFKTSLGFLSRIGNFLLLILRVPNLIYKSLFDPKTKKKHNKALRQKYLFIKAEIISFKRNFFKSLISPFKISKKKTGRNLKSFSNFISRNNDPLLTPFLFFIRTPKRTLASSLVIIGLFASFYVYFLKDLPSPYDLVRQKKAVSSRIFDRNGKLLFTLYNGNENRTIVRLAELPPYVYQASIAIEDKDFYHHHGLSIKGVFRALESNILHRNVVEGGSTITQQLVKNALLSSERTVKRKVRELMLAFGTEMVYSKNEILEMYLNEVPYGGAAYGIQQAAELYFGKQAKDLSLAEASLLAGLPAAPTAYSPHGLNKDYAKTRQAQVLKNMVSEGYISKEEAAKAKTADLAYTPNLISIKAPHFVMWVRDLLNQKYGSKLVEEGGLDIYTTLDLDLQEKAEEIVKRNVELLEKPYWISNSAALVTNPKTGEVLAMVGSRDFFDITHDGNVNVTIQPRQPGSSIKVINYAYALGHGMTPTTIINDSPISYKNAWETYTPVNYDGKYRGNVTLRGALAMSLNIPAVKTLATYGPDKMKDLGVQMGIKSWVNLKNYGLSLTLGAGEVKMTELATAYGTIANYGKKTDLNPIKKIVNYQGLVLEDTDTGLTKNSLITEAYAKNTELPSSDPVISPFVAYELTDILSDNKARLPTFGPYAKLEIPGHKVAVKTGTTDNKKDNWTVGYTPSKLVAVWVGNNNNTPMNPHLTSGITGAAPIWNEIMTEILKDKPDEEFIRPEGMVEIEVCEVNGLLPCDRCPKVVKQFFVPGQEPTKKCYFPSPVDCAAKKAQLEKNGKKSEEITAALAGCPLPAASTPKP